MSKLGFEWRVPEAILRSDSPGGVGYTPRLDVDGNAITFK